MAITNAIYALQNLGVLTFLQDFFIPFFLIFVILFAVLQKTNILGKEKRNWNMMLAILIALTVVVPHLMGTYPPNADIVKIINKSLPNVSVVIVAIVMFLIVIGVLGGEAKWLGGSLSGWIALVAFALVVIIFGISANWFSPWNWPTWLWWLSDSNTQALVVLILVMAIVIWFITKDENKDKPRMKFMSDIGDFFAGKK